jgi:hypothetical protein
MAADQLIELIIERGEWRILISAGRSLEGFKPVAQKRLLLPGVLVAVGAGLQHHEVAAASQR